MIDSLSPLLILDIVAQRVYPPLPIEPLAEPPFILDVTALPFIAILFTYQVGLLEDALANKTTKSKSFVNSYVSISDTVPVIVIVSSAILPPPLPLAINSVNIYSSLSTLSDRERDLL